MNYIFLLLLLGRGGRGRDCGCQARGRDCGCGRESGRRERTGRQEACGCEAERPCREEPYGRAKGEREDCDGAGMIPPPWQEYPRFPRREGEEGCGAQA